ncbi:MAG: hypothetical protein IT258_15985 [Saprospiraceae bacterium]|nr:hypothetical protein [Saprospiraceae bacterium]
MKKLFFSLALSSLFLACKNEPSTTKSEAPAAENPATIIDPNSTPAESIMTAALEESDTLGRLRQSFIPLQEEFNKSKGIVPEVGDVTVTVDEQLNLLIENKLDGHVYLSKVKIRDLKRRDGGILLLPDFPPRKHPGLKIKVKEGRPKVQLFKDGKLEKEEEFIEFTLKDRPSMERVVPAIVQAMNISKGFPARMN